MAGTTNCAADAMSRHPAMSPEEDEWENEEEQIIAGIYRYIEDTSTIAWEDVARETNNDDIGYEDFSSHSYDIPDVCIKTEIE